MTATPSATLHTAQQGGGGGSKNNRVFFRCVCFVSNEFRAFFKTICQSSIVNQKEMRRRGHADRSSPGCDGGAKGHGDGRATEVLLGRAAYTAVGSGQRARGLA